MKFWDIIREALHENLTLIKDAERYRSVLAARIIGVLVLAIATVATVQLFQGKITFDMGFVLGIFAIFISWLFFWSAEKISRTQMTQLQAFLRDFREESSRGFDTLSQRMSDVESVFKDRRSPPSPPPDSASPESAEAAKAETLFAEALSEVMKEGPKQIIIAMQVMNRPISLDLYMIEYSFELGKRSSRSATMIPALAKELRELGMVEFDKTTGALHLSERGTHFANWLVENDQKASFFECPMLGITWGEPSEHYRQFMEKVGKKNG
jgi:hypothetical protein